jgi:hypothetical protein
MPATTPNFALPYPVAADTADVPRDIQALASKLDTSALRPPAVTVLPSSPSNGNECYFRALSLPGGASESWWHLRYDTSIGDAYKWRFLGGASIVRASAGAGATSGDGNMGNYGRSDTFGPQWDVPLDGYYELAATVDVQNNTAAALSARMIFMVGGISAVFGPFVLAQFPANQQYTPAVLPLLSGGDRLLVKNQRVSIGWSTSVATASCIHVFQTVPEMSIRPIRVGP